jgi:hypothetical protein
MQEMEMLMQGTLTEREESFSTVDLLIKIGCFVKRKNTFSV